MKLSLRSLVIGAALVLSAHSWAATIIGLTATNEVIVFDATTPQNVVSIAPITGLAAGEQVLGIDVRPANGRLYGLTSTATFTGPRLVTIDPNTGEATVVAALSADPADLTTPFAGLSGTHFAIDFNPQADRLRVESDTGQNLRVNPGNGRVTTDTPLTYGIAQPKPPGINAIAYTNNVANATSTTLLGIDDANFKTVIQGTLDTQGNRTPNDGVLTVLANFGLTNATHPGFDIAPDGAVFVAGRHSVPEHPEEWILATLDPTTGGGGSHGPIGDGTIPILDIAVSTAVSFSAPLYAVVEQPGSATITVTRSGFTNTAVTVQYATLNDTASAGTDYTTAAGTLSFAANETSKTFQVPIKNDNFPEEDEFLDLVLFNVTGTAVIGAPGFASVRINANDRPERVGPQIVRVGLTGPSRGITGAVLYFNEDMDPQSVQRRNNYNLTVVPKSGPLRKMFFSGAVYDPVERKLTLTLKPFAQTEFAAMSLRVNGSDPFGVKDIRGNLLDGDRNGTPGGFAVHAFKVFSGTRVTFVDRDLDVATLILSGGGRLDGIVPLGGPLEQRAQFWILDPIALRTTLSGGVSKSVRGDGIVVISEIIGLDKKEFTPLLTNTSFRVNTLTFSSNATGIG
jgi:hypothetical protein